MRRFAAVLVMLGAACGGDEDTGDDIEGNWYADGPVEACAYGLRLEGDDDYVFMLLCELEDGSWGMQVEKGTWEAGDDLVLRPTHSSCPGASDAQGRFAYNLDGDSLTLGTPAGSLTFARNDFDDGSSGGTTYGCYDDEGLFTASPVEPI